MDLPDLFPAADETKKFGILEKAQNFTPARKGTGANGTHMLWIWRAPHPTKWLWKG